MLTSVLVLVSLGRWGEKAVRQPRRVIRPGKGSNYPLHVADVGGCPFVLAFRDLGCKAVNAAG